MISKAALFLLKHLIQKPILTKFVIWKFLSVRKKNRMVSKIPLPKSVKDSQARERTRPESPSFRVPKSEQRVGGSRPTSAPPKRQKGKEDIGARLHSKAQEIEEKKEKIRRKMKVDYSFKPMLAENTNRWLNKSTRESNRDSHEEIAVVSSAAILNFVRNTNNGPPVESQESFKTKPFIMNRSGFKYVSVEVKENLFN